MPKSNLSLRFSLTFAFVMVVLLTSVTMGALSFLTARIQIREGLRQRLGDIVAAASLNIDPKEHATLRTPEDMETPIYKKYREQFARLRAMNPDIRFLYTMRQKDGGGYKFVLDSGTTEEDFSPLDSDYDEDNPNLVRVFQPPYSIQVEEDFYTDRWGQALSSFAPILGSDGKVECVIGLDISASRVIEYETRFLILALSTSLIVSLLGAMGGILFSRRISKPLLGIAEDMGKIQQFILDDDLVLRSRIREVKIMTDSLSNMKKGLKSFRRYVPAEVVAQLISLNKEAILETSQMPLTIFFSDLENFTGISEKMVPETLALHLAPYFKTMTSTLQDHEATVDKFIGDSVMAFWNAPLPVENHEAKACHAALACSRELAKINDDWMGKGFTAIKTRIGINTGLAVVGNIGYAERLNYTTLGDAVNLASRLESLNKYYGTSILIGQETRLALGPEFTVRLVDRVAVKGKSQTTELFELISDQPLDSKAKMMIDHYNQALDAYFRKQWSEAEMILRQVLIMSPGDGPSLLIMNRVKKFQIQPPALDWNGVTVMDSK